MRKGEKLRGRRTINRVAIVANGTLSPSLIPEIRTSGFIIGVDRAAYWLLTYNIVPNLAVGDFDSTTKSELREIEKLCQVKKYPPEKDWTDLELAVKHAVTVNTSHIIIYGAIGTRFDHTLAASRLLAVVEKAGKTGLIKDVHNEVRLVSRRTEIINNPEFTYISIIPATGHVTVTLAGFKFNAEKLRIRNTETIGISNEINGKSATIIPHRGKILVIRSRD